MSKPTVSVTIDHLHPKQDKTCNISIRVTYARKPKYYSTGICLIPSEFERVMNAKRRTEAENKQFKRINSFLIKAIEALEAIPVFTFDKFEEIYLSNREATDCISVAFDKYIKELKDQDRIGTAVSYECSKKSLNKFRSGLKFADITPELLRRYENWMTEEGNSLTTVGIYLRSLRTIFNRANIDKALYPFGENKGKYSIPTGRNIKKALSLKEIKKIIYCELESGSTKEMARDYWVFIYLCNGMNVKDFCKLKWGNIDGDLLTFQREKTKRSKKEQLPTKASLKETTKGIIKKWAVKSVSPESYVFPHLQKGMDVERERQIVQQLTKTINKYMKGMAKDLGINKPVTTYYARHSFATVLHNSGASTEFISEALAHSSQLTTKSYLASFEHETIHKTTDALLNFGT
jgi:integrase/recombinase XerD